MTDYEKALDAAQKSAGWPWDDWYMLPALVSGEAHGLTAREKELHNDGMEWYWRYNPQHGNMADVNKWVFDYGFTDTYCHQPLDAQCQIW